MPPSGRGVARIAGGRTRRGLRPRWGPASSGPHPADFPRTTRRRPFRNGRDEARPSRDFLPLPLFSLLGASAPPTRHSSLVTRHCARSAGGRMRRAIDLVVWWFGGLVVWWLALPRRSFSNPISSMFAPRPQRTFNPGLMSVGKMLPMLPVLPLPMTNFQWG